MATINNATANAKEEKIGKINNASLPSLDVLIQAGIDPKTGLPIKCGGLLSGGSGHKASIKANLRIIDEQQAVNRYKWENLPCSLTSEELERLIYYKGQLAFFYIPQTKEYYFMPYALDGGIDFYGRFNRIHPVPFAEGITGTDEEKRQAAKQRNYLSTLKLNCIYDTSNEIVDKDKCCVLLHDYTKQLSQTIIPRQQLQEGLLDVMSDCIPFMRTALLNSTGIQGMRVNSEDEQSNVTAASALINRAALKGEKYVGIVGQVDFQDLTGGQPGRSEEFLLAMQALDNFRLSTYGIENGGLFEKKAHTLESEQAMNTGNTGIVYNDGLSIRQHFCELVNEIWGLNIQCTSTVEAMGVDTSENEEVDEEESLKREEVEEVQ